MARLLPVAVLLLALVPGRAHAVDIFSVGGVEVDVVAESAVRAREEAIREGQRLALRRVLERLTTPANYDRLPSIEDADMTSLVRSFEIEREQMAATRYVASMFVAFDGDAVRRLLRPSGVPIVLEPSEPLLVVPAVERAGRLDIWDATGPWRDAWSQEAERNTLLDLRLPLGDLPDMAALPQDLPTGQVGEALAALAARYGAAGAVLVVARPASATPPDAAGAGEVSSLDVEILARHDWPDAMPGRRRVAAGDAESVSIWRHGVRAVMQALEDDWKRDRLVTFGEVADLFVRVPLGELADWVSISRTLHEVPEVQTVSIETISQSEATVDLGYVGGRTRLDRALGDRGLELTRAPPRRPEMESGQSTTGAGARAIRRSGPEREEWLLRPLASGGRR
ncbi:MAG: DUF2066 domain-containing protein [Geminicoccaceae bacterium]|nr:DUF2066 domain-containing protein [Geminicoccaceae bacterium]